MPFSEPVTRTVTVVVAVAGLLLGDLSGVLVGDVLHLRTRLSDVLRAERDGACGDDRRLDDGLLPAHPVEVAEGHAAAEPLIQQAGLLPGRRGRSGARSAMRMSAPAFVSCRMMSTTSSERSSIRCWMKTRVILTPRPSALRFRLM